MFSRECQSCKELRATLALLQVQLHDREEALIRLQESHAKERGELVDKLLAVQAPMAYRELTRPARINTPASVPSKTTRPPVPNDLQEQLRLRALGPAPTSSQSEN